jgi:hypothetical protein
MKGGRVGGVWLCVARLDRFALAVIARHEGRRGCARRVVARAWLASDATHSRVVVGWVRRRVLARRSRARVGAAAGEGALAVARGAAASVVSA